MPQSGFTPVQHYRSATAAATPSAGNLVFGELALNYFDGNLFFKDASNIVRLLASTAAATGTVSSVQASGGTTGLTFSGGPVTTAGTLTLGGTLAVANGGTGATDAATARANLGAGTGNGTVTSVGGTGTVNGLTLSGTVTSSGSLTLGGALSGVSLTTQVTGTLPVANGGTGATAAPAARTNLGATTVGSNLFTLTNPSAITFPRLNADNTVSALNAADFRTAIGVGTGTGTVLSVSGTGTVNGLTLTGTVTSSGSLTLGGALSGVSLASAVTGTLPVANGGTGATDAATARANLGAGTVTSVGGTGTVNGLTLSGTVTSSGSLTLGGALSGVSLTTQVTGTLPVANGGTGATDAATARANLGATTVGAGVFTAVDAAAARAVLGVGTGTGSVTSVQVSGGTTGLTATGGPITSSGTITLGGTLAVANGGTGVTTSTGSGSTVLSTSPIFGTQITVGGPVIAGTASGVSLQMADNSAIRNTATGGNTMYFDSGVGAGSTSGDFNFRATSSFTSRMYINGATGNVGIGTTGPGVKLDVIGEVRSTGFTAVGTTAFRPQTSMVNYAADGTGGYYTFYKGRAGATTSQSGDTLGTVLWHGYDTTNTSVSTSSVLSVQTGAASSGIIPTAMVFANGANNERMRIDNGGNVGIGTSAPARPLSVRNSGSVPVAVFESALALNPASTDAGEVFGITALAGISGLTFSPSDGRLLTFGASSSNRGYVRARALEFIANDETVFSGATERMRITDSGNVGIGTSSPGSGTRLNVAGRGLFTGGSFDPFDSTASGVSISYDTVNNIGHVASVQTGVTTRQLRLTGSEQTFFIGATERMRIDGSGNVGIGLAPSYKLDVLGGSLGTTAGNSLLMHRVQGFTGNATQLTTTLVRATNGSDWTTSRLRVQGQVDATPAGYIDYIPSGATGGLAFGDNASEFMRIAASGNVGIGTGSPATKLQISAPSGYNEIRVSSGANSLGLAIDGSAAYLAAFQSMPLTFQTNSSERMRIDSAGNIGIGTSSPGVKLDVAGNAIFGRGGGTFQGVSLANDDNSALAENVSFIDARNNLGTADGHMFFHHQTDGGSFITWATTAPGARNTDRRTERMRIDNSGNVGIGTSSPSFAKLQVSNSGAEGFEFAPAISAGVNRVLSYNRTTNAYVTLRLEGSTQEFYTDGTERFRITSTGAITSSNLADAVGYKGLPSSLQSGGYNLAMADQGGMVRALGSVNIPANSSVAFPVGTTITVYNNTSSNQTISITTDTLRLAGTATTGSRTVAQRGFATLVKVDTTEWVATGNVT